MADVFDQIAQDAAQQAAPQGTQAAAAQQAVQPQAQPQGDVFDQIAADEKQKHAQQAQPGTPEEQAFLGSHPTHVYMKADAYSGEIDQGSGVMPISVPVDSDQVIGAQRRWRGDCVRSDWNRQEEVEEN